MIQTNGQITARRGQLADKKMHALGSPFHIRQTARGRIGQLTALCLMLLLASCGVTERISTEREVNVNQRDVAVPVPGHVRTVPLSSGDLPQTAADTLTIEDDRVRITVRKSATDTSHLQESEGPGRVADQSPVKDIFLDNYLFDIEVFPDTITTTVTDSTITERTETVRTETETGAFAWMTIGGLVAIVIVLLVAFLIRS